MKFLIRSFGSYLSGFQFTLMDLRDRKWASIFCGTLVTVMMLALGFIPQPDLAPPTPLAAQTDKKLVSQAIDALDRTHAAVVTVNDSQGSANARFLNTAVTTNRDFLPVQDEDEKIPIGWLPLKELLNLFIPPVSASLAFLPKGAFDGYDLEGDYVEGWTCIPDYYKPLKVRIFAGVTKIATITANQPGEVAIKTACKNSSKRRFIFFMPDEIKFQYAGLKLKAKAVVPNDLPNGGQAYALPYTVGGDFWVQLPAY